MDPSSLLRRLAAYYFLSYGALGWLFPQMAILVERAVGPAWVGWVMVSYPVVGLVASPIWGVAADRYEARLKLLMASTLAMVPTVLLYGVAQNLGALVGVMSLFALLRAPQAALADALAHAALEGEHHRFPQCRMWGSVGFVLMAAISGALGGVDAGWLYVTIPALAYLLASGVLLGVPEPSQPSAEAHPLATGTSMLSAVLSLARQKAMWVALLGLFIYYSGHALFDAYFGIHVAALGLRPGLASTAWSFGAFVEIVIMLFAPRLLSRVGGRHMLAPVSLLAALRWWLTSVVRQPALLIAVQGLHGFSFGLWYLSIVNHLQSLAPPALRSTVSGLTMAVWGSAGVMGYGIGGLLVAWGPTSALYRWAALLAIVAAWVFWRVPGPQDPKGASR